jgi:hypothetical protein
MGDTIPTVYNGGRGLKPVPTTGPCAWFYFNALSTMDGNHGNFLVSETESPASFNRAISRAVRTATYCSGQIISPRLQHCSVLRLCVAHELLFLFRTQYM